MTEPRPRPRTVDAPFLGVGVGLRPVHYNEIFERLRDDALGVDWFEILSENFMLAGGKPLRVLDTICKERPVVLHGVSMNLGSADPIDRSYLDDLDTLVQRCSPRWVSDHLCWTGVSGRHLHDLVPLPYCDEVIEHVAGRIAHVQDRLGRRIAIENVSSYMSFAIDAMPEWDFLAAVAERADCGILLDVNNVYVSSNNHGFDARRYLDSIPADRVFQIHLAGHSSSPPLLIDTHDHAVCDDVWDLYEHAIRRIGPVSTSIEWDDKIPPFPVLLEEVERARKILDRVVPAPGTER